MGEDRKPFKLWFDEVLVRAMAARIAAAEPRFAQARFVREATRGLDDREMMARVGQIADALHASLPRPTAAALRPLVGSLGPSAATAAGITGNGYHHWPIGEFIARYGLDDVDASFDAMIALTQRFTAEFAVRPFLAADPDGALGRLEALLGHGSLHVRRWISEGTRTRLPWAKRVPALEARALRRLALLAELRHDPEPYVRRSVANHLQDLLKDEYALALPVLRAWAAEGAPSTAWIARHAARGLLKRGDPEVLALFGYDARSLVATRFAVGPKRVAIGEAVELVARVRNTGARPAKVRLDFELASPGARDTPTRKVFRFADCELAPGEEVERATRYAFVHRTIRAVRAGTHRFELRVNGRAAAAAEVRVSAAA